MLHLPPCEQKKPVAKHQSHQTQGKVFGDPNGLPHFPPSCEPRSTKREEKWITIRDRRDRKVTEEACINITFTHMRSIFIKSINGEECELLDLFEDIYALKRDEHIERMTAKTVMDYSTSHLKTISGECPNS